MYLMHWSYMFNIFNIILRTSWFFRPQLASDKLSRIWMRVFTVKTMGNSDDRVFFLQSFPFKVLRRTAALVSMCSRKMQKSAIFRDMTSISLQSLLFIPISEFFTRRFQRNASKFAISSSRQKLIANSFFVLFFISCTSTTLYFPLINALV